MTGNYVKSQKTLEVKRNLEIDTRIFDMDGEVGGTTICDK